LKLHLILIKSIVNVHNHKDLRVLLVTLSIWFVDVRCNKLWKHDKSNGSSTSTCAVYFN